MSRLKTIFILFLFICTYSGYGQVVPADGKCPPEMVFNKSEFEPVYKPGIDSMKIFFDEVIFPPKANGTIELKTIICYQGDAIVTDVINKTGVDIDIESLKRWVFQMRSWKPGVQNGRYIGFAISILLTVKEGGLVKLKCTIGSKVMESK